MKNKDELYFNLIGDEWDTSISNVTFKITMPKEFDKSLLGFSSGYKGSTQSSNISYSVDGNVIRGSLQKDLYSGEALTVRLTLTEGYFLNAKTDLDIYPIVVMFFSLVCVLISFLLWLKYGKDDDVIETKEFCLPAGYNSAELGYFYYGTPTNKCVVSLLIYLANKGYLKLEKIKENNLSPKNNYRIVKLKEYDGNNENERIFLKGLFKNKKTVDFLEIRNIIKEYEKKGEKITVEQAIELSGNYPDESSVTFSDLYNRFYSTISKIQKNLNSKENRYKVFEKLSIDKIKYFIIMMAVVFLAVTLKPIIEYDIGYFGLLPFSFIFNILGLFLLYKKDYETEKTKKVRDISLKIFFCFLCLVGSFLCVYVFLIQRKVYLILYFFGIICMGIIMKFAMMFPKRTAFGNEMLGKIKGFKRFLEIAKKTQLEELVAQNPEYFYNILPYTYTLGVSDIWISQFEDISIKAPYWYDFYERFDMNDFGSFINETMKSATAAMTSTPSNNSDSSGGGSSGGGSGGGGGGSW